MRWFRLYSDLLHDPKAQRLSPALFKAWINLLCLANESEPRGVLPEERDIAFKLRIFPADARKMLAKLTEAGLLDRMDNGRLVPHNWDTRQRRSDDINERVRRHRAEKSERNASDLPVVDQSRANDVPVARQRAASKVTAPHHADVASFLETAAIGNGNVTLHDTLLKRPVDTDTDTDVERDTKGKIASNGDVVEAKPSAADAALLSLCSEIAQALGAEIKVASLKRLMDRHPAFDAGRLIFEAEMAAQWIANPKKNLKKQTASSLFFHNWLKIAERPDTRQENGHATTTKAAAGTTYANGTGARRGAVHASAPAQQPDAHNHGPYAHLFDRK